MVASTYSHHLNVDTLPCTSQHFPVYMVLTKQTAEIQCLLGNMVHFYLSLSRCGGGEPGNMHPFNSDA